MSRSFFSTPLPVLLISLTLASCGSYRKNIMFQVPEGSAMSKAIADAEGNYVIQPNDLLTVQVYTNSGERLVDPDFELLRDAPPQGNAGTLRPEQSYLVNDRGVVKLPMVGEIKLEGFTLRQAEEILQQAYAEYYEKPFVVVQYQNKRIIVLGAPGGQVIPLQDHNVTLVEALALAKGIDKDANASNIRVLRGNDVIVADLSTVEGYTRHNIVMKPGDVIYVEPVRRPVAESIRDYAPLITILTSLTTLIVVLVGL